MKTGDLGLDFELTEQQQTFFFVYLQITWKDETKNNIANWVNVKERNKFV